MEQQQAPMPPLGPGRIARRPPSLDMNNVYGRPVMPHQMPSPNKWLGRHVRPSPHQSPHQPPHQPPHQSPHHHYGTPQSHQSPHHHHYGTPQSHQQYYGTPQSHQSPHQQHYGTPQSHLSPYPSPYPSPHKPHHQSPHQPHFGNPHPHYGVPQPNYVAAQQIQTVESSGSSSSGEGGPAPFDEGAEDDEEEREVGLEEETFSEEDVDNGPTGVQCTDLMCLLGGGQPAKITGGLFSTQRALPAPTGFQCRDNAVLPSPDEIALSPSEVNDAMASVRCSVAGGADTRDKPYVPDENHYDFGDDEEDMYAEDEFGHNYQYPPSYNFPPGYQYPPGYNNCPNGAPGPHGHPCPPGQPAYNYPANYPPGYNYPPGVPDAVLFSEYEHRVVSPMSYHESLFTTESGGSLSDGDEFKQKRQVQKIAPVKKPVNVPFDEPLLSQISFVQEVNHKAGAVMESFEMQPYQPPVTRQPYKAPESESDEILEDRYNHNSEEEEIDQSASDEHNNPSNEEADDSEDESVGLASYTPSVENVVEEMAAKTRAFFNPEEEIFDSLMPSQSLQDGCPSLDQLGDLPTLNGIGTRALATRALVDAATVDEDCHDLGQESCKSGWTHASSMAPSRPATTQAGHRDTAAGCQSLDDIELERMQSQRSNNSGDVVNQTQDRPEPVSVTAPPKTDPVPLRPLHNHATINHEAFQESSSPEPAKPGVPTKVPASATTVEKTEKKQETTTVVPAAYQPKYNIVAQRPCLDDLDIKTMQTHPSFDEHPTPDAVDELMGGRYGGRCPSMEEPPSLMPNNIDRSTSRAASPFTIAQTSSRRSGHFTAVTQSSTRSSYGSAEDDNCSIDKPYDGRRTPVKTKTVTIPSMLGSRPSTSSDSADDLDLSLFESGSIDRPFGGATTAAPKKATTSPSPFKTFNLPPVPRQPAIPVLRASALPPRQAPVDEQPPLIMKGSSSGRTVPKTKPLPPGLRDTQLTVPGSGVAMGDVKRALAMRAQYDASYKNHHYGKGKDIAPWELTRRAILITTVLQMFKNAPQSKKP